MVKTPLNNMTLLDKIIARQKAEKLSDYKFAPKIGIERSSWTYTRQGKRAINIEILSGVLHAYPDMANDVLLYLFLLRDGGKRDGRVLV